MNSSDWIALGSLVIAISSALSSLVGFLSNRRHVRAAEDKAERATAAAERSANALERTAQAAERHSVVASRSNGRPRVAWRLTRGGGDSFLLMNAGTATAYDVAIEPMDEHTGFHGPEPGAGVEIAPTEDVRFFAALTLASTDDRMLVSWLDHPEAEHRHEWRRNLPP